MVNNEFFQKLATEILEVITDLKLEIQKAKRPPHEVILDDVDLRELLKVSKRTTATWREQGIIKHSWLIGKCYYRLSDVLEAIDKNAVPPIPSQDQLKK